MKRLQVPTVTQAAMTQTFLRVTRMFLGDTIVHVRLPNVELHLHRSAGQPHVQPVAPRQATTRVGKRRFNRGLKHDSTTAAFMSACDLCMSVLKRSPYNATDQRWHCELEAGQRVPLSEAECDLELWRFRLWY